LIAFLISEQLAVEIAFAEGNLERRLRIEREEILNLHSSSGKRTERSFSILFKIFFFRITRSSLFLEKFLRELERVSADGRISL